ncbi:PucR family transcriptional regulator ligand-binding domain-containing protein [Klebsiella pneumoniae]|nr:PucR family transcriptional regulator ligand-binding domain-containing protein [Klebsiella pneumoniae]
MSLTVSELLALEGLSALRLRAGKQGLQRAVRWYYVAENEHIAEWIMRRRAGVYHRHQPSPG